MTDALRVLVAYFSRAGENYHDGGRRTLEEGNTAVLAKQIAEACGADMYRIEAAEPYSDDYDATVHRNVEEEDEDARPAIAGALPSVADYDVLLLGCPSGTCNPR